MSEFVTDVLGLPSDRIAKNNELFRRVIALKVPFTYENKDWHGSDLVSELLRPLLAETGAPSVGKMVIGTVKGDIHDIGKNLVSMMMEGAGFDVVDLGINCAVEKYLDALEEHKPDILGMSALLTTTMPYMKVVIDTLKDKGIRGDYVVLVGGAPLNEAFAQAIGADAYCRDAAVAVETAKAFVARRHNRPPAPVAACA